ncbi:MAG: RNA-binding protein [Christensenellales bacterium]
MKAPIQAGYAAISKKGRDKGRLFVVLYELDADFVLIADGDLRRLDRPKKKRRKHLAPTSRELPGLMALYHAGRLKDSDIRTALSEQQPLNPNDTMSEKEGSVFVQK